MLCKKQLYRMMVANMCTYETPKIMVVESVRFGILYRALQLIVVGYVVGYAIVWEKGYHDTDIGFSSVISKVKGTSFSENRPDLPAPLANKVWDTADYVIPAHESNAFFVMTNAVLTKGQRQTTCAEHPNVYDAACNSTHNQCVRGKTLRGGNGYMTGNCVRYYNADNTTSMSTCEVQAWCPLEEDDFGVRLTPLIPDAVDFTVLLKNFVEFPKFGYKLKNIVDSVNNASYLRKCVYDPDSDPFCPIFRLGDILKWSILAANKTANVDATQQKLLFSGGLVGIFITWECNFDVSTSNCMPTYRFRRLDEAQAKISPGWNFRYANYYSSAGDDYRDLYKAFGLLFIITVEAHGGKFGIVPLLLNVGSGLALLGCVEVVCDLALLHIGKKKASFRNRKFDNVFDEDVEELENADETTKLNTFE